MESISKILETTKRQPVTDGSNYFERTETGRYKVCALTAVALRVAPKAKLTGESSIKIGKVERSIHGFVAEKFGLTQEQADIISAGFIWGNKSFKKSAQVASMVENGTSVEVIEEFITTDPFFKGYQ